VLRGPCPAALPLQSEELVEALKREGKTYEYRTYPDEGHGLLRHKNQLDFYGHMERFVDWYLL
jgi:dipeptidyl aminopeptidase/acylaminoacyl peptidase